MAFETEFPDSTVLEKDNFPKTIISINTSFCSYRKKNLFTNPFNNHSCRCYGFIFNHEPGNVFL